MITRDLDMITRDLSSRVVLEGDVVEKPGWGQSRWYTLCDLTFDRFENKETVIIIHQTHYENSDWSRAFNQFTIACELDMVNALSAADIAFIMSSSTSAWLLSPLELLNG